MRYLLLALALVPAAGAVVQAQGMGDARAGLGVAQSTCADCHAIRRGQTTSPNAAAPAFQVIADARGTTRLALRVALLTPHKIKTMPNIILPEEQLADVIAYILSLRYAR